MNQKELNEALSKMEHWQKIIFEDGSNPYICKNKIEFARIAKKYQLKKTDTPDWWISCGYAEDGEL